jgi:hypothetical protein
MRRTRISWSVGLVLVMLATAASLMAPRRDLFADVVRGVDEPVTRFERFLLETCSPCVKESVQIATLQIPSMKLAAWTRTMVGRTTQPAEIGVEALRSYLLGRPTRQMLAVRLTMSVATGNPAEVYRMAAGVVDEEEIGAFVSGLGEIIQAVSAATPPDATGSVETDVQTGTIRVGVIRLKGESMAYMQAGDIRVFARRPVWESGAALYLPVAELPALRNAINQAAVRIQKMRVAQ